MGKVWVARAVGVAEQRPAWARGARLPLGFEIGTELREVFFVFAGQHGAAGTQAVLERVHRDGGFALGGAGACRFLRVAPVGVKLFG